MEGPFTSDAALLAAIREKLEACAALLEACELHWDTEPGCLRKRVLDSEGNAVFFSEHDGLLGAAEAEQYIRERCRAAIAKARNE